MRRVKVMSLLEHLKSEVWEEPAEPSRDLAELVGVTHPPKREVDGMIEAGQRIAVEIVGPERLHERSYPARTVRHPGRRIL